MNKIYLQLAVFLIHISVIAQQTTQNQKDTLIKGKISLESNDVDGIVVQNLTTKSKVLSSNGGYFIIKAKENDTLQFTALHVETKNHILKAIDFKSKLLLVQLNIHIELLKEVAVTNDRITAESLGIIPAGQKKYTTAERRLHVAKSSIGIDPLFNWISGRTFQLKKEVVLEEKERILSKISAIYENEYFIDVLHIPELYINGFMFYLVEDEVFFDAVKSMNKSIMDFRLFELSKKYLNFMNINSNK